MRKENTQAVMSTEYTLSDMCGFNQKTILRRIELMGLNNDDKSRIQKLLDNVLSSESKNIVNQFYEYLLRQPEMKKFLISEELLVRLKHTQTEYLATFGADFESKPYFEYRLRIGIAHARIQLPLNLYIAAFSQIQILVQQAILNSDLSKSPELVADYYATISKIIMLDTSIAIDSYIHSSMQIPSSSVQELELQINSLTNRLMHDSLTGVLSRAYILDILHKQISQHQRDDRFIVSLALLDIDHFKKINDQFGHPIGDQVLQQFCTTVQSAIRRQDYFGRYGGEEFLLLINDDEADKALNLIERIRSIIEKTNYEINGHTIKFTISLGFSEVKPDDTVEKLIQRVDSAMYKAKAAGRNQIYKI